MRNGVLVIYDLPDGDINDMYVDFKLFNGNDECLMTEHGAPIKRLIKREKPSGRSTVMMWYAEGWNAFYKDITGETE